METNKTATNPLNTKAKKIAAVAAAVVLIAAVCIIVLGSMGKPMDSAATENKTINIESGLGTGQIAEVLAENEIIDSTFNFKLLSRVKGYDNKYKAGRYTLSASMSFEQIAEILMDGKVNTIKFTIPEGYTIYQVADKLSQEGFVDRAVFVDLLENEDFSSEFEFLKGAQDNKNRLEGYLYPNTYIVDEGATERDIIVCMLNQFEKEVTEKHYKKAQKMNLTMNEVLTIASIIERECDVSKEGALVASVVYNRLEIGMALQMCSTVQYILGEPKAILSIADTQIESPYNTYLHQGLPPGPICSPGIAAIEAALNPADTDYIYFVLSDKLDGTSNFSNNYEQFQRDSAAYGKAYEAAN